MPSHDHIVVLILSTVDQRYEKFKLAIRNTWMKDLKDHGIKCFFYEGNGISNTIDGDTIKLNVPDNIHSVSKKFLAALQIIFEKFPRTKIIYRTNLSSFIDIETLLNFIEHNKIDEDIYIGCVGITRLFRERFYQINFLYFLLRFFPFGKKIRFASGSGFFLGATHCRKILSSKVNTDLVDDVMVADTLKISPKESLTPLRLIASDGTRNSMDENTFDQLINEKYLFHYRFKTHDRDQDAKLLMQFGDRTFRKSFFSDKDNLEH